MIWWLAGILWLSASFFLWRAVYLGCQAEDLETEGNLWASSVSAHRAQARVVASGVFLIAAGVAAIIGLAGLFA